MAINGSKFSALTAQQKADTRDAIRGYKIYSALFTQLGSNAPTVTILENTIGNIVWSYNDVGLYDGLLIGGFPEIDKIAIFTHSLYDNGDLYSIQCSRNNNDCVQITCRLISTGALSDDVLARNVVEIRKYI